MRDFKLTLNFLFFQIKVVNGVILVAWQQKILERQIDYGAKLGHVVLSLAKMELANFYKNVMPVADYFDQRGMLITVNIILLAFFQPARWSVSLVVIKMSP